MTQREDAIRVLLNQHPDGLSTQEVTKALGIPESSTRRYLTCMADVYIDRWCKTINADGELSAGPPFPIHCAVPIPRDCPSPSELARRSA
jgi:hypothetical protein